MLSWLTFANWQKLLGQFAGKPYDVQPSSKQQCLTNIGPLTSSSAVQKNAKKQQRVYEVFHLCNPINLAQACHKPFTA
jgi:hypothetical protein